MKNRRRAGETIFRRRRGAGHFRHRHHVSKQSHRQNCRPAVARRKRPVAPRARVERGGATLVENAREKLAAEGKPAFIIAGHYGITGLYSFYIPQARAALKSEPLVYSADSDDAGEPVLFLAGIQLPRPSQGPERHFCRRSRSLQT